MLKQLSFVSRQCIKVLVFIALINPTFLNALNTHARTLPEQLSAFSEQTHTTSLFKKPVTFKNYSLRSLISTVQKLVVRHPFITSGIIATLALGTLWYFKKSCAPPILPLNIKIPDSSKQKESKKEENPVNIKKIVGAINLIVPTVITAAPANLPRESNACWLASTIQLIYNIPEVKDGLIKNASSDFGKKTATLLKAMETTKSAKELEQLYRPVYESACKEFKITPGSFSRVDYPVESLIVESKTGNLFDFDFELEDSSIFKSIFGTDFFAPFKSQQLIFSWKNAVNYFSSKEPFKLLKTKKNTALFFLHFRKHVSPKSPRNTRPTIGSSLSR